MNDYKLKCYISKEKLLDCNVVFAKQIVHKWTVAAVVSQGTDNTNLRIVGFGATVCEKDFSHFPCCEKLENLFCKILHKHTSPKELAKLLTSIINQQIKGDWEQNLIKL